MATKSVASEVLCTHLVFSPIDPVTNFGEAISCRSLSEEEAHALILARTFKFRGIRFGEGGRSDPDGPFFDLENADATHEYLYVSFDLALSILAQVPDPDVPNELNPRLETLLWNKKKRTGHLFHDAEQFKTEFAAEYLARFGRPSPWATQPELAESGVHRS